MLTRPFDSPRRAASSACLLLLLAAPLAAAPQGDAPKAPVAPVAPVSSADRSALRRDIERLYEVLPTHDGLLLRPRAERVGVRTIEISGDEIAVNGNRLSAAVLREWLGAAQADPVIRLAELDPASRRALFDLKRADAAPATSSTNAPGAPPAPPSPPVPQAAAAPASDTEAQGSDDQGDDNAEPQGSETADDETPKPRGHHAGSSGSILHFGGSVTVRPGENPEEVTVIGGSIQVDGEVAGDVVAVGGSCTINGKVAGSVTAVGGSVHFGPNADVGGDVVSVGGGVEDIPATARVHGSTSSVSALEMFGNRGRYPSGTVFSPFVGVGRLIETLTKILLLALLACLMLLVARPSVERVAMRVAAEPGRAGVTGLLCQLAFLPLFVVITILLVLTIIGCALVLLYPFLFIALLLAGLLGYAAVAYRIGHWAEARFGWRYTSPYMMVITGVALLEFLPFVGRLIGLVPFLHPLGLTARLGGFILEYVAWTVGFGAVVLDFLATGGLRRFRRGAEPLPVPAPAPMPPMAPAAPVPPAAPPPAPEDPWETR